MYGEMILISFVDERIFYICLDQGQWVLVVGLTSGAMLLAAVHRLAFASLAITFAEEFHLSFLQLGFVQSAYLWGYLFGQVTISLWRPL